MMRSLTDMYINIYTDNNASASLGQKQTKTVFESAKSFMFSISLHLFAPTPTLGYTKTDLHETSMCFILM